jgi:hypothetical protein
MTVALSVNPAEARIHVTNKAFAAVLTEPPASVDRLLG